MYKLVTAKEAVDIMFGSCFVNQALNFTFDQDLEREPSDWFGMKLTELFDESEKVFTIGYYGGGCTECYDIFGLCDDTIHIASVKEFCVHKLQKYMDTWCEFGKPCEKICVEIK